MATTHELSQAAFDRLKAEHEELTTHGRIDIARKIEEARALGDLSENGDYHAAKEEQGKMEARVGHLAALLENAVIIDDDGDHDVVKVGSVVTIVYDDDPDDDAEQYLIGSIEEKHGDYDVISPTSPLGEQLMGRTVGDELAYEVRGQDLRVRVLEIKR
ncbi:MAG TPA: transcription elongation factor GreA [Microthrixaceae bacterium]|nr:transcription elongation factor GreA [Microthrixaceae bacterium]